VTPLLSRSPSRSRSRSPSRSFPLCFFSPPDLRRADFPEEGPLTGLQGFAYNPA